MNSLQQFVKTLSPTVLNGRHFDGIVGDVVFVQNGYGKWLDQGFTIIGFDKSIEEKDWIYLDWDCYWFGKNPAQVIPEKSWAQRSWLARAYSISLERFNSLGLEREYNIVSDWDNPIYGTDIQLIEHSKEFFRWTEADDRGIFLVHNEMAFHFFKKEIKASSEPEYYQPIETFWKDATVVLNIEELDMLERVGLEQTNTPALAKLTTFVQAARNEITNGNIVFYRAF